MNTRIIIAALAALLLSIPPGVGAQQDADGGMGSRSRAVLITGANRGIGLELARQYSAAGWRVIGTARKPEAAEELAATGHDSRPFGRTASIIPSMN